LDDGEGGFPRASQTRYASQREVLDMAGLEGVDEDDLAEALDEAEEEDEREEEVLRASQVVREEREDVGMNGNKVTSPYKTRVEDESEIIWDDDSRLEAGTPPVERKVPEFEAEEVMFEGDGDQNEGPGEDEEEVMSDDEHEIPATQRNSEPQVCYWPLLREHMADLG
jgi:hypothetical protein